MNRPGTMEAEQGLPAKGYRANLQLETWGQSRGSWGHGSGAPEKAARLVEGSAGVWPALTGGWPQTEWPLLSLADTTGSTHPIQPCDQFPQVAAEVQVWSPSFFLCRLWHWPVIMRAGPGPSKAGPPATLPLPLPFKGSASVSSPWVAFLICKMSTQTR